MPRLCPHAASLASAFVLTALAACGPASGPTPDDPALVFVWDAEDGDRTRYDLREAAGGPTSFEPVETAAELHGPRALLGGVVIDADGHGLDLFEPETKSGTRAHAELSPDGTHYAFITERTLRVGAIGEPAQPRLEAVAYFAWAADSASLLVARSRDDLETPNALERVARAGTDAPEPLARFDGSIRSITPIPDGSFWLRRASEGFEIGESLHRLDPSSGELALVHQTKRSRNILGDPTPSAAAGLVAFISSVDNTCRSGELWLAEYDGGDMRRVTRASCRYLNPDRGFDPGLFTATADGRFVGMASRQAECSPSLGTSSSRCHDEIYVYDPGKDELRRVTDLDLGNGIHPSLVSLPRL